MGSDIRSRKGHSSEYLTVRCWQDCTIFDTALVYCTSILPRCCWRQWAGKIECLSDLTHVGGAVKVSWAEMEASQDSLVAPTCGNGRAAKVRVQLGLGQAGKLGNESEFQQRVPAASPASPNPQRCCGPLLDRVVVMAYSAYPIR